ncbi:carbamoyl-phosphate synthase (glutamine-hydrolyzing) cpa2, partial [Dispira simplex]
ILNQDLHYPLFADSSYTAQLIKEASGVTCQVLDMPYDDKRHLLQVFQDHKIDFVINLAKTRPNCVSDPNYRMRRSAVDFGIPLVNDPRCARLFAEALAQYKQQRSALTNGEVGDAKVSDATQALPSEVLSWEDFHAMQNDA